VGSFISSQLLGFALFPYPLLPAMFLYACCICLLRVLISFNLLNSRLFVGWKASGPSCLAPEKGVQRWDLFGVISAFVFVCQVNLCGSYHQPSAHLLGVVICYCYLSLRGPWFLCQFTRFMFPWIIVRDRCLTCAPAVLILDFRPAVYLDSAMSRSNTWQLSVKAWPCLVLRTCT
jgi:hypothetical protein